MLRVGMKVVCVDATRPRHEDVGPLVEREIYTIRDVGDEPYHPGETWVLLFEINNPSFPLLGELGYDARRFRPAVERKTDISIFTAMLKPSKVTA